MAELRRIIDPHDAKAWFESVLRSVGPIRWNGHEGKCKCPFHDDRAPSFGVNAGKGTWICYAGCGSGGMNELAERLGVEKPLSKTSSGARTTETHYDYRSADGALLFQVVRIDGPDGKKIWQRSPDGNGGWVNNIKGITPVPFRLPELSAALAAGKLVFVAEGEKCVERLAEWGLIATTNHGGALKWRDVHSSWFPKGARVNILPDADEPGEKHASQVASALAARGCHVKILDLGYPRQKVHGNDIADWMDEGHTLEELREIIRSTPEFDPEKPGSNAPEAEKPKKPANEYKNVGGYLMNDIGNGERLVDRHGPNLRYCHRWKKWLSWDGLRWEEDAPHLVARLAVDTVRSMYGDAESIDDELERKRFLDYIVKSGQKSRLDAMIAVAASGKGIPVEPGDLDRNKWLLNLRNGTLDLRTGALLPHERENMITKLCPVEYDSTAGCPEWDRFLLRIMNGDEEMVGFLRRAVGYSLTGSTKEHCMFMLYGVGRNGKSTFLNVLRTMLGDYGRQAAADTFMAKRTSSGPGDDVAALRGARLVSAIETEETQRLAESLVKQLTGGDAVSCRRLYENFFEFQPEFKIYLATNHKPNIRGTDEGIWRRVRLIPFTVRIPDEEMDPDLPDKLQSEFSGILAWAMRGCLEWQAHGLMEPDSVLLSTEEYRREMDTVGAFLGDRCIVHSTLSVSSGDLYRSYSTWCDENGERAFSQRMLAKRLTERGFLVHRGTAGKRYWTGLGLKNPDGYCGSDASDACGIVKQASVTQQTIGITDGVTLSDQVTLFSQKSHMKKIEEISGVRGGILHDPYVYGKVSEPPNVTSVTSSTGAMNDAMVSKGLSVTKRHSEETEGIIIPWEDDPDEREAIRDAE